MVLICLLFYSSDHDRKRKNRFVELTTKQGLTLDEQKELAAIEYDLKSTRDRTYVYMRTK